MSASKETETVVNNLVLCVRSLPGTLWPENAHAVKVSSYLTKSKRWRSPPVPQALWCRRPEVRTQEVDPLLWGCHSDHFLRRAERLRPGAPWRRNHGECQPGLGGPDASLRDTAWPATARRWPYAGCGATAVCFCRSFPLSLTSWGDLSSSTLLRTKSCTPR